jgi:hypothetical protein
LGIDFLVAHNPLALRPVPHGLIAATREYWAKSVDGGYELVCHDTADSNDSTAGYSLADILEKISRRI